LVRVEQAGQQFFLGKGQQETHLYFPALLLLVVVTVAEMAIPRRGRVVLAAALLG